MADIQGIELLTANEWTSRDGKASSKIRLVQWVSDGKSISVKLEKRKFFKGEDGTWKTGKADGFNKKDLESLRPHWPKIKSLMDSPPPVPGPGESVAAPEGGADDPGF
mgnify:CR=1 FL=1